MQLVENVNPDDDTPVDNVCAQISDEEDSGDEVHFKKPSKTKKIINVVRNAIRKVGNHSGCVWVCDADDRSSLESEQ